MKRKLHVKGWHIFLFCLIGCAPTKPDTPVPESRFVKLDSKGRELDPKAGPWSCVGDKKTGLIWEVKSANEGLQFARNTFSWYADGLGVPKRGACARDHVGLAWVEYDYCDTQDLIRHLNQRQLCGRADWRLPSSSELRAMMFKHDFPGERRVFFSLFPRIIHAPYWTSESKVVQDKLGVLTIHMATGEEYWRGAAGPVNAIAVSPSYARESFK